MSRKLFPLAVVLGVVAVACAEAPVEPSFGSGQGAAVAVVDSLNDAGRLSSVAVVDGRPVIAYTAFEEEVPEGSFPETRPIGLPTLPGVMLATVQDGIWTRGAIAIEQQINNVQVAFNPAFEESVGALTPETMTGLQLVADDGGMLHAVWGTSDQGLFYAMGNADPASTTQWMVEQVDEAAAYGPSLALDGSGNPWIAYTSGPSSADLVVATKAGSSWTSETAATGAGCDGCRTGIAVNGAGAPIVAYGDGTSVSVAAPDGRRWGSAVVEPGSGIGLAAAPTPDGAVALSYEAGTQVHVASGNGSGTWTIVSIADIGEGEPEGSGTGVAIDDQGAWTVAWYDPGSDSVQTATSPDGQTFTQLDLGNTTGAWSPAVASTPEGTTSFVSWYASGPQDLILGAYGELGELAVAAPSPTPTEVVQPTGGGEPPAQECTPVENGTVTVVAEGIAFTDGQCIEAPAGEPFTIVFDNRDADVQHNIQVFEGPEVAGSPTFSGDLITGPSQIEYEIPALDDGEYAYDCLVHPNMIGKIVVGAGGGAATGPTGPTGAAGGGDGAEVTTTVVAQNIAFDTDTITLAADVENTITLDNRDAGVQHNIAIYTDSSMAEELFNGELITGASTVDYTIPSLPAGEYYFVCIVHPNMNGTVIVQ